MKLKAILLSALVASASQIQAQNFIGYSNGDYNRQEGKRLGAGTQGLAIKISAKKAQALKGCKITALNSVFGTSQTKNVKLFITKKLGSTPVVEQASSVKTSTRWTNFPLNTPYEIDGDEFYIGMTMDVASSEYRPFLFDQSVDLSLGSQFMLNDGTWEDASQMGYGAACLRLQLDQKPQFADLVAKPVEIDGFHIVGKEYDYLAQVYNFGTEPVTSFDIECSIGNGEAKVFNVKDVNIQQGETYNIALPGYVSTEAGNMKFTTLVTNVNGTSTDADADDNTANSDSYIYPADIRKKILLEEFTGAACPQCPEGAETLEEAIEGNEDQFVLVAHHLGYRPDNFSMAEDQSYLGFFANGGQQTYAPAVMANRTVSYDGAETPIVEANVLSKVSGIINNVANIPPYVSIDIYSRYDSEAKKVDARVSVYTHVSPSDSVHSLNLYLVQNGITGYPQASAQYGTIRDYVHNHVFRGAATGTWGKKIDLVPGQTVTNEFTIDLPDEIVSTYTGSMALGEKARTIKTNPANMYLVAFVGDHTTSYLQRRVYNVEQVKVGESTATGIGSVSLTPSTNLQLSVEGNNLTATGDFSHLAVYSTSGAMVASMVQSGSTVTLPAGLYVVKATAEGSTPAVSKVLIK